MLNKKVLAAAVIGGLFAGNAAATDFTAGNAAAVANTAGLYAKEIKIVTGGTSFTATAQNSIVWALGMNLSPGEIKHVRIEAGANVKFNSVLPAIAQDASGTVVTAGSLNGAGTNVLTFSITADAGNTLGLSTAAAKITLPASFKLSAIADSDIKVSLYDTSSQAQQGGTTGLNTFGSYSSKYFKFAPSLEWVGTATPATADVAASPSYTLFTTGAPSTSATLSTGFGLGATGTFAADGTAVTVGTLLDTAAGETTVSIAGDFSYVASAGATPFNAAAAGRVLGFGGNPIDLSAAEAVFDLAAGVTGNFGINAKSATSAWNPVIPVTGYVATLNGVSAAPATYDLPQLGSVDVSEILHNGTTLQAPLAQIPGGWISRLVLTNTSGVARPYTISVMTEAGVTVTTANLTGTIPANGTKVIDNLSDVFSGSNRATLNVDIAATSTTVQGLYQIVNPTSGSISNHVLVRPGTN